MTTLDSDLWKTLSNWTDFVKKGKDTYLNKHSFVLTTNKNESNNEFIDVLNRFKIDEDIDKISEKLTDIKL